MSTLGKRKDREHDETKVIHHGSTLFVSNLPYTATSTDLNTLFSDIAPVRSAFVVLEHESGVSKGVGYVSFAIREDAESAIDKISKEGIALDGRNLRVQWAGSKNKEKDQKAPTVKKRTDVPAKAPKLKKPKEPKPDATPSRASRLIVRNLPWNITEQDLRAVFLPYGPIHSVHIPTEKLNAQPEGGDAKKQPRAKGFAFVWMLSRKGAEKAIGGCNGMTVHAGMAESMVSDEQKKKKQRWEERKQKQALKGEDGGADGEHEGHDESQRVIAVDWALSKDKWEAEKAKIQSEEQVHGDVEMVDAKSEEGDSDDEGEDDNNGSEDDGGHVGVHDDGDDSDADASDDEEGEEEDVNQEPVKPTLPPPESGTTLFVRNVPFEATEDELRTLFRAFGPLRYARITMDPVIGRSRGTGFVCFWNKSDADKAVEQSDILRAETVGNETAMPKKNPFKLPSILTPDPSASIAKNLVLHGRTLDVIRAVTRDEAGKLKEVGEKQREKADKRNLYLLREGIILPNTPAAESLSATEVEKRTQSFNARRALLRSNPSLYVSRTRLSIRQLPIFVTERMLKRLAIHAVRAFETEVKKGARPPLSEDELTEPVDADAEDEEEENTKKSKSGGKGRDTGVKQAKIVRQQDRVDAVTGKGRSRGYGFLETTTHADALRVLRWANNNSAVGPLFEAWWKAELEDLIKAEKRKEKADEARVKRLREEVEKGAPSKSRGTLIAEFSIENVQVVQRRAAHQRDQKSVSCAPRVSYTRLAD
ncbi:putative RNA-binding protein C4F6.14 [Grifola frondosa]|uniref:Putative RNA-binding protein C4F6.14 n=1 Tax=Grifola frondosa TaxID=5627 RepID=A0A1C7MMW0_GRIFR|nr:putative RNA-binding protein C4F6.14 [Grifola frondosa]